MSAFNAPAKPVSTYAATFTKNERLTVNPWLTGLETRNSPSRAIEGQHVGKLYHSEMRAWPQLST